jgi:transcriptional regulator with XRE-family HTH domain
MTIQQAFGQVLRTIRQERGLSQEQLGFESGYHRTYISLLERGKKNPSLNAIFELAAALQVSPSEMIRRVETQVKAIPRRERQERT